jgi:hypothetical protein
MFRHCIKYEYMLVVVLKVSSMTTLTSLATTRRGTPGSHASNFLSYQNATIKLYILVVPLKACYEVVFSRLSLDTPLLQSPLCILIGISIEPHYR